MPLVLIFTSMSLAAQPGAAAAKSIKDCEKIQAADAYNLCLASFGPVAHEHDLKPVPAGVGTGKMYGLRHHRHYAHYRHGRGHRKSIELSVGGGAD